LKILILYAINVMSIAFPLAILEIWLEQFKVGKWGATEFQHPFWGKKIQIGLLDRITEKSYVTPYHLMMFGAIIPAVTILNFLLFWHLSGHSWLVMDVGGAKIVPIIFLPTVWLGNMVTEDFLWFAIQSVTGWREPKALERLLAGDFVWHTEFVELSRSIMLPRFYIVIPLWVAILLVTQSLIVQLA